MILNKIYMPIEKHTINIIFFPILHFFSLNKNSENKIAMSIIVIAHTIIYLYFEFVNYAVITNLFINAPLGVGYFDNRHPAGVFPDL